MIDAGTLTMDKLLAVIAQVGSLEPNPVSYRRVVTNLREQHRRPKSRRKRIRKKWGKDPRNFRLMNKLLFDDRNHVVYGSREVFSQLDRADWQNLIGQLNGPFCSAAK